MNKTLVRNIVVIFLLVIAGFLIFRYVTFLQSKIVDLEVQKQNLLQDLKKEKDSVGVLEAQKADLKDYLRASQKRMKRSFADLKSANKKNETFDSQFNVLKAENSALLEEKQALFRENETMKTKLSSIEELKKAIREIKIQRRLRGNRGFIVKDGENTQNAKVKIEVTPVPVKQ